MHFFFFFGWEAEKINVVDNYKSFRIVTLCKSIRNPVPVIILPGKA